MTTITFDTLKFVRRLKDAGIPEHQAEAISDAFKDAQEARLDELATKRDLKDLELKIEMAKTETIKWVISIGIVILGGVAAINRLAPPPAMLYERSHVQEARQPQEIRQPSLPVQSGK
ncbi:MAG: CCDC90 family protein [Magnetococcus sp. DMHC-1]